MTKCGYCQKDVWCTPFEFDGQKFCTSRCSRKYRKDKAIQLLKNSELSLKEIGQQCDLSVTTLYSHKKKLNPEQFQPTRSRRGSQSLQIEDLLKNTKYSYTEIAEMYHLSRQRIGQIAERAGLARQKELSL